jgi:hypothetical protein
MDKMRNAIKILVRKPEEKTLCGRSRHRVGDNIKLDLNERWCVCVE